MGLKVSVVIRTRDVEKHFKSLLRMLMAQTLVPSDIIVVNNYSSKDKLMQMKCIVRKMLREARKRKIATKMKLALISDEEFSHPYSTNLGVKLAENELVCITNAHSLPVSNFWLENGVNHFRNSKIACVSGYFFPDEKNDVIRKVSKAFYYLSERFFLNLNWCSTVNCIIRKSLWKEYPFNEGLPRIIPETRKYGLEDYDWSKEMEARGYKIVIDRNFSVYHSHEEGLKEVRRNLKNYFVYSRIQKKIDRLKRPRKSYSRVGSSQIKVVEIL